MKIDWKSFWAGLFPLGVIGSTIKVGPKIRSFIAFWSGFLARNRSKKYTKGLLMLQMAGGNSTGSRTTSFALRESSPPLNGSPLSPRSYPSDGQDDRIQLDVTALINESHHALNSLDNEIDNNHENDNGIDNNHENTNDERLPVSFNELGQWNGPAQFSTWIGEVTRAKIPLKYHNWTKVPSCYKEEVWDAVQSTYQVTEINKAYVLFKSNSAWRTEKAKQRRKVMDAETVQEKKRRVPTYYNKDDWEAFIDYNTSDGFKEKSKKAAEARSQVQAQYTGGRKGIPRTWLEMEQKSPTGEVYRPKVYLATHNFVPDDNPLSSKSLAAAKIAKVKEAYDKEPSAQNCLSTDAVSREFGVDRKGYVRGMGAGVSKTLYHATAFMKARLQKEKDNVRKEKQKNEALKAQLDAERQINSRGHDQISSSSYQQEIGTFAPAPSSFRLCFLRNFRRKAVACAYVDRAKAPNDDEYDCMINEIMDSNAMLCDRDGVLGDVSKGAMIKWPKSYVTDVGEPMI